MEFSQQNSHFAQNWAIITNSHNDQLPVGLIAQLVEHCTGIAEVMGYMNFHIFTFNWAIITGQGSFFKV